METSSSISNISPAVVKAQAELTNAPQNQINPYFKSSYAGLATVIDHVRKILEKNGLAVIQGNCVSEAGRGVCINTLLLHESGEYIKSSLEVPVAKNDPQELGKSITYGRRYALSAILGISSEEDIDANPKEKPKAAEKPPGSKQVPEPKGVLCGVHKAEMKFNRNGNPYHRNAAGEFCNGRGFPGEDTGQAYPETIQ